MSYPTGPPAYSANSGEKQQYPGGQPQVPSYAPYPQGPPPQPYGYAPQQAGGAPVQPYGFSYQQAGGAPAPPYVSQQVGGAPAQSYGYTPQQAGGVPAQHYNTSTGAVHTASQPRRIDMNESGGGFTTRKPFDNENVRRLFVRKVFIVLALQLLVTFGIVTIFTLVEDVREWVQDHPGVYGASYAVFLVLFIVLACGQNLRRKSPANLIVLGIFTLALSYMTGTIAAYHEAETVMIMMGVTALACGGIILFSMQTKFDFTKCSGVLFVLSWVLFMFCFITIFTYYRSWYIQVVYGCLGALLFSLFLAFDVQLVMGGKKYELDPEEYVFGALTLYTDIIYIFLFLLMISKN